MNDLNLCQFIGRLGKDPEVRYSPNGDSLATFSIACGWKTKTKEGAEWINITVFGKLAEICGQYLKKGSQVYVAGRMRTEKYTTKEGVEKYGTKVIADTMQMLSGKSNDNQPKNDAQEHQPAKQFDPEMPDDDIPF